MRDRGLFIFVLHPCFDTAGFGDVSASNVSAELVRGVHEVHIYDRISDMVICAGLRLLVVLSHYGRACAQFIR